MHSELVDTLFPRNHAQQSANLQTFYEIKLIVTLLKAESGS